MFIGNDIVCLDDPLNLRGANSPRYRSWVLTDFEQDWLIHQDNIPLSFLCLWAFKESVYKVLMKKGYAPFKSPKRIPVRSFERSGSHYVATYRGETFYGSTHSYAGYLLGIASDAADIRPIHRIKTCSNKPNTLQLISEILTEDVSDSIRVDYSRSGIPVSRSMGSAPSVELSASHDGPYFALSYITQDKWTES